MPSFRITLSDGDNEGEIQVVAAYDPPLDRDADIEDLTPAQLAGTKLLEHIQLMLEKAGK